MFTLEVFIVIEGAFNKVSFESNGRSSTTWSAPSQSGSNTR